VSKEYYKYKKKAEGASHRNSAADEANIVIGDCALCQTKNVQLIDSHYIPAGVYKLLRSPHLKNQNPVLISASTAMTSAQQASDFLLCAKCERRLNDNGENWVVPRLWHSTTKFQLRDDLIAAGPLPSPNDFLVFEAAKIPGLIPDQLCYFGASIFWRGGAHDWKFQRQTSDRLPLGPYQESLRLFLLGGAWPAGATLQVFVGADMSEMRNNTAVPAYERYRIPEGDATASWFPA